MFSFTRESFRGLQEMNKLLSDCSGTDHRIASVILIAASTAHDTSVNNPPLWCLTDIMALQHQVGRIMRSH